MRIVADTDVCVGAGQCVLTDPETFDQSEEDGTVIVLAEHPADEQKARDAVHICPSQALKIAE
ncbi:ferredoxin [Amycolatopsis bartoniae]|uniref:Ferredoxin n=1 Tax=Amycolatopsis bartoniae TaxID=941986 RepID=A0A8H9MFG0_9PSEU|nr:ferredoxin [Amycolatopsis bartoniae]MBB2937418.1 ferredoxin [Amycolatopsis bartoniae]TVS99675.1 ferredoxin [Amycolatopsis bartoniae]GHF86644.1 ferredoxin [Amycolatopsis bartoniae]